MTKDLFFEIGTEEIPARFISSAISDMKRIASEQLQLLRIPFDSIEVFATPRRFAILIRQMADRQEDLQETFKGPAKKICLDENNNPTKALIGFVNGKKGKLEDVTYRDVSGEEYAHLTVFAPGEESVSFIKDILDSIIRGTNFPKPMRWGNKSIKFIRPIRWLISLYGSEVIHFDIEGIQTSNITKGHRFLGNQEIAVENFDDYKEKLAQNFVILDHVERREIILNQVQAVASEMHGTAIIDPEILDEVNFIVEYPTAFSGAFNPDYLNLPREVVTTPMEKHQRYFPVIDNNGHLINHFITVRNGNSEMLDNVRKGNLKVLDARLQDARFFYHEDTKRVLADYIPNLDSITFHKKLGSMRDKSTRIQKNAQKIASRLQLETPHIQRTAELCKADLSTQMVFEFGELQGIMGMYYAQVSGEDAAVARGIMEHYLPRNAEDSVPKSKEGIVVSLADKIDTICAFFSIGITPTGSQDQFALRRQAIGILRILIEHQLNITLSELVQIALQSLSHSVSQEVEQEIVSFLNLRLNHMMLEMGLRYDVVNAVSANKTQTAYHKILLAQNIEQWLQSDKSGVLAAYQRGLNIIKDECYDKPDELCFEHDSERQLYAACLNMQQTYAQSIHDAAYMETLLALETLVPYINNLFEQVMIMHENPVIKQNRLKLVYTAVSHVIMLFNLNEIVY